MLTKSSDWENNPEKNLIKGDERMNSLKNKWEGHKKNGWEEINKNKKAVKVIDKLLAEKRKDFLELYKEGEFNDDQAIRTFIKFSDWLEDRSIYCKPAHLAGYIEEKIKKDNLKELFKKRRVINEEQ